MWCAVGHHGVAAVTAEVGMNKHGVRATKKQLLAHIWTLEARLADPEGEIGRQLNKRYSRDLRERELEHHALWDQEVAVYQAAASRRMRGLAADLATAAGQAEIAEQILALPIYAEEP